MYKNNLPAKAVFTSISPHDLCTNKARLYKLARYPGVCQIIALEY